MILIYLLVILLLGAFLAWITGKQNPVMPRIISLIALSLDLILIILYVSRTSQTQKDWLIDIKFDWIPALGISLHFALDGLSLVLLLLTLFLGIISVIISWKEIRFKGRIFSFQSSADPGRDHWSISFT